MLDPQEEARLIRSMAEAYQEVCEMTAKGKVGGQGGDQLGTSGAAGGGKGGVWTPARGAGADKRHKNDPAKDDARAATQAADAKAQRVASARTKDEDKSEGMDKSKGIKDAEKKANFTSHQGPPKIKKLKSAKGPRSRK